MRAHDDYGLGQSINLLLPRLLLFSLGCINALSHSHILKDPESTGTVCRQLPSVITAGLCNKRLAQALPHGASAVVRQCAGHARRPNNTRSVPTVVIRIVSGAISRCVFRKSALTGSWDLTTTTLTDVQDLDQYNGRFGLWH